MTEHTVERIVLARLPSGIEVTTTVHTYAGSDSGPTLYVQAAQHGREVNGTEVLRRLHDRLDSTALAGTLIAVPVADPLTFDRVSYTTSESLDSVNANMNRVWPGDSTGSLHERMAARLWEFASGADAVIDLHTGSPSTLTHVVFEENDHASRTLADVFGTDLLLGEPAGDDADEEWAARGFGGKFRVTAAESEIPSITPELAHNKQLIEPAIETGVTGILNVLRHLSMLDGEPESNGHTVLARNHLSRVAANDSGLFRTDPAVELGQEVSTGERLGALYASTTYERLQTVEADRDGVLYSLTQEATAVEGDTLARVAVKRE
ncbi:succinylglutamate desuccinylase/aspartoacylase family protein [Halococcus sediminicola]|uniref:succinylglutamate desuccinylase/aspartoacylase family protein n=1 Tax=Halococcus sediminicola TaxID=1264579 RepID=UPI0006797C69|nr:succinylglutamate desuccinylase/aspartoacylase family protein [Halococcus sediminicola]